MLHLMKLEDRIVLDGAAVGEAIDHAIDHDAALADAHIDDSYAPTDGHDANHLAEAAAGAAALLADPEPQADPVDVVLISDNLSDVETLKDAVDPDAEVIVYDADGETAEDVMDRVAALSEELGRPIESVTILSHGGEGTFHLGKDAISAGTLADHAAAWETLDSVLAEGGRINLYGCNVSGGEDGGQDFLDSLAEATGADVYASDDVTGHEGDWDLEAASGDGDSHAVTSLDVDALDGYLDTLNDIAFTENEGPVVIDPTLNIATTTSSYLQSATVTLTGIQDGEEIESIDLDLLDTSIELDASYNDAANTLVLTLGGTEVVSNYERVLRTLTYDNTSDVPTEGSRNITIEITELGGTQREIADHQINVAAVNDAPWIFFSPRQYEYGLGTGPKFIVPNATDYESVFDAEENYDQIAVSVDNGGINDDLSIQDRGDIAIAGDNVLYKGAAIGTVSGGEDGTGLEIAFDFSATQQPGWKTEAVQAVLGSIAYSNNAQILPTNLTRTVSFRLTDSEGADSTQTVDLSLTKDNVAPQNLFRNSGNFTGASISVREGGNFVFSGRDSLSITDPDAPATATLRVTLDVNDGTLDVVDVDGLTIQNDNTGSVTLEGTMSDINGALDGMTYSPEDADYYGTDQLTIETNDLGNLGTDGNILTDRDVIAIDVEAVNDLPSLAPMGPFTTNVNTPLVFDDLHGTQIIVEDVDAGDADILVELSVAEGTLHLTGEGANAVGDTGDGTDALTLRGTVDEINLALNGMTYQPPENTVVTDTLNISVNDEGNTGSDPGTQPPAIPGITINVVENVGDAVIYPEDNNDADNPIFINSGLEIDSFDIQGLESYMVRARVTLNNIQDTGNEFLYVHPGEDGLDGEALRNMGITAEYNSQTGVLTLIGTATVDQYEAVLQHVAYQNTKNEPNVIVNRGVDFQLTGLGGVQSGVFYQTSVDVQPRNDYPVVPMNQNFTNEPIEQIDFSEGIGDQLGDRQIVDSEMIGVSDIDSDFSGGFLEVSFVTYKGNEWQTLDGEALAQLAQDRLNSEKLIGLNISEDQLSEISETPVTEYDRIKITEGNGITIEDGNIFYLNVNIGTIEISSDGAFDGNYSLEEGGLRLTIRFNNNIADFRDPDVGQNAAVNQLIRQINYQNINAENPVEGLHMLQFEINDGDEGDPTDPRLAEEPASGYDFKIVQSQAINDTPVNFFNGQAYDDGEAFVNDPIDVAPNDTFIFSQTNGNALSIGDVDAYNYDSDGMPVDQIVEVTLTAGHGTLALIGNDKDRVEATSGEEGTSLTIRGTVDDINQALANSLAYTPDSGYVGGDAITMVTNDLGNSGTRGTGNPTPLITTNTIPIDVLSGPGGQNRPPYEPPPYERPPLEPIWRPGIGEQEGIGIGPIIYPGEVQDTGDLQDIARALTAPCGDDVLYQCCTLEEALKIGCRFAPAIDPDSRLCNITWDYMTNSLGWEDPFAPMIDGRYFNEELDLFNRLFMKDVESDPGFHVEPNAFADAFGMDEEVEFAKYNRDEEHDVYSQFSMQGAQGFNDMAPGELKEAFFKGREGLDKPSRWDDDSDASEC